MVEYLVDANLPYRFSIWNDHRYVHQADLGDSWTDNEIWDYAKKIT
jgi:predicted nuclease of predicted toxin-antitoxin system